MIGLISAQNIVQITEECERYQPYSFVPAGDNSDLMVLYDLKKEERVEDQYSLSSISLKYNCYNLQRNSDATNAAKSVPVSISKTQLELLYTQASGQKFRFLVPVNFEDNIQTSKTESLNSILNFIQKSSDNNGKVGFFTGNDFTSILLRNFTVSKAAFGEVSGCDAASSLAPTDKIYNYDCLLGEAQFTDYFLNQLTYNWPMWFLVIGSLLFVFTTNFLKNGMTMEEKYKNNFKTFHPLYSLHECSSETIFTKRSRIAQIFIIITAIAFFNALMTRRYIEKDDQPDQPLALRLTVFPIFSIIFSIFVAYITGILLSIFYRCHRNYITNIKGANTHDEKKHVLENYEASMYQRLFAFYIICVFVAIFFMAMSTWFLYGYKLENQGWWLLQVVIAVCFDWLVLDVLIVFLARISFLASIFKIRGFWFDYDLHEQYIEVGKPL